MNLENAAKAVAVVIVLVGLRVVIQVVVRRSVFWRRLPSILPFCLPPLLTGGPMFIAFPAMFYVVRDPSAPSFLFILALGGGLGLALGLTGLLLLVNQQGRELAELREQLAGESPT
jgi:hypothetical protein